MTVRELIEKLEKIDNQDAEVVYMNRYDDFVRVEELVEQEKIYIDDPEGEVLVDHCVFVQ